MPVGFLARTHCSVTVGEGIAHLTPMSEYSDGIASGMLRWGYAFPLWKLGFVRQTHHTHRTCGATATSLRWPPLSDHARVPFKFPRQVRPCPRGRLPSTSPFCERYLMCAETAHGVSISFGAFCMLRARAAWGGSSETSLRH